MRNFNKKTEKAMSFFLYIFCLAIIFTVFSKVNIYAATYTVTNTGDSGAGSLRQAVFQANATPDDDMIVFNIPASDAGCSGGVCTITLTTGEIQIQRDSGPSGSLSILNSTGANRLRISGNNQSRIFYLSNGWSTNCPAGLPNIPRPPIVIEGVTITGGNGVGRISSNGSSGGGGILNNGCFLILRNSTVSGNKTLDTPELPGGGGIWSDGNILGIINTTISGNTAAGVGGGIYSQSMLRLVNSTVSGNLAKTSAGGGIYNDNESSPNYIMNSTISGNTVMSVFAAPAQGGGIFDWGNLYIINSTIAHNLATGDDNTAGGGYFHTTLTPSWHSYLRNTIIANNAAGQTPDVGGSSIPPAQIISRGNNLIGDPNAPGGIQWQASDIFGAANLGPLADNGGPTQTHALLPGSPAINAGNNCILTANGCAVEEPPPSQPPPLDLSMAKDQRGASRVGTVDIGAFEFGGLIPSDNTQFDFDGDGRSDISVFRPDNGAWYLNQSTAGFTGYNFGFGTDLLAPADFDGDGRTDVAVFRDGAWYYLRSSDGAFIGLQFGQAGDLPRPADFDGDGKADINVFRPSNGAWYRLNSSNGAFVGNVFGQNGDKPLVADFDGDGKSDIAVFRPTSSGTFFWLESSTGAFKATVFGFGTDIPTTGDFDGDGKTDIAVFRPSNGAWYRYNSSNGAFVGEVFGQNGDIPVSGDYDGDGKADIAVFRPSNGTWFILQSSSGGFTGQAFGVSTDKPVPAAFSF